MASRVDGDRARVTMPVFYPSGASAAVDIQLNEDKCFITDSALGYGEAEMYAAQEYYAACAKKASDRFGVGYDGIAIFASWSSIDRIEGAISAVANASVQAASTAIFRASEEKEKQRNAEVYEKVLSVFGRDHVNKKLEVRGRETSWEAHNVVLLKDYRPAIFEFVTENSNSISNKFMMFSDLSRVQAERSFSLNSVVKSVSKIGQKGAMLSDVSNIIELGASPSEYLRYARAA